MRHIGTESGRVIRLVAAEDIRPPGGAHGPTACRMLSERYSFAQGPDLRRPWEEIEKEGFKFRMGTMTHGNKTLNIADFSIHNDGLVTDCSSTDEGEIFLKDVTDWGKEVFGFKEPPAARSRTLYLSFLVVEFDLSPNSLLAEFGKISESLGNLVKQSYGLDAPFHFTSLGLNYDRTATPPSPNIGYFLLERRTGQPFEANRFYSEAPLRTQDHLALLKTIESTMAGPGHKKGK